MILPLSVSIFSSTFIPHTGSTPSTFPGDMGRATDGIVGIIGAIGVSEGSIGALPGWAMKRSGSASNFAAHPAQQK